MNATAGTKTQVIRPMNTRVTQRAIPMSIMLTPFLPECQEFPALDAESPVGGNSAQAT